MGNETLYKWERKGIIITVVNGDAFKIGIGIRPWRVHALAASNTTPLGPFFFREDGMGDWKEIPVCGGFVALVDAEDYDRLSQYKWHRACANRYPYRGWRDKGIGKVFHRAMHNEIMPAVAGLTVDHINGDVMDNRRCNLRYATKNQQMWNKKKEKNSKFRYKGVARVGQYQKGWVVRIRKENEEYFLGNFDSEIKAAQAYDEMAKKLFGEFARLNFPRVEHG